VERKWQHGLSCVHIELEIVHYSCADYEFFYCDLSMVLIVDLFYGTAMATSKSVVGRRKSTSKNHLGSLTPLAVKMASRTQEIRPVGAWVEPATYKDCSAVVSDQG